MSTPDLAVVVIEDARLYEISRNLLAGMPIYQLRDLAVTSLGKSDAMPDQRAGGHHSGHRQLALLADDIY